MLVRQSTETVDRLQPSLEREDESTVSPMLVFSIVRRRKFSILFTLLVLSGLSIGGAMLLKPSFVATASVLMQDRKSSVGDLVTAVGSIATDSVAVRTQADILRSADLARTVVRQLKLFDLPEFSPHPSASAGIWDRLRAMDRTGLVSRFKPAVPPTPITLAEREELATQTLLGMTSIINDGRSYVIDIKIKVTALDAAQAHRAAALSAELANSFADAYVQLTGQMKSDSIRQANSFFDERISVLQAKMRTAEHAVETYRVENGLVEDHAGGDGDHTVTNASQQMAQLNAVLVAAAADRANKEASLQQINIASAGDGRLASVPEVVGSPLIQRLREQQAALGAREAALAASHGAGSPELMAIHASQRDVARQIAGETDKIAASLRSGVAAARAREAAVRENLAQLQSQVGAQGQTAVKLHELQNEADIARGMYSTYLKRFEETANQIDMQDPDAVVVSRAGVPLGPMPPSRQQVIIIGVVVSCFLATLQAIVRERLQSGFRSPEQLEATVGVETLGMLPKVRSIREALRFDRYSAFSEAIFSIRAVLRHNARREPQVVMVTSALPKEGKTFFSSALARNAAIAGERVLLIDCDLRRPAVAQNITALESRRMEDVTIRRDSSSPLDIITLNAGLRSPQDLFASPQMRNLITLLRDRYDLILLDTPPVLAVSDARILSSLSDVTILVVCWQKTSQRLVNGAVSVLRNGGAVIAGTVMTQVKLSELDSADGAQAYVYRDYAKDVRA
jgi:capsular exopolysaccharide synthesis family protein